MAMFRVAFGHAVLVHFFLRPFFHFVSFFMGARRRAGDGHRMADMRSDVNAVATQCTQPFY